MECCKEDLGKWVEAAIRRLAEAGIIRRERVDACTTMFRGMIVIATIDFLYGDKPLGQDLARSLVKTCSRVSTSEVPPGIRNRTMKQRLFMMHRRGPWCDRGSASAPAALRPGPSHSESAGRRPGGAR